MGRNKTFDWDSFGENLEPADVVITDSAVDAFEKEKTIEGKTFINPYSFFPLEEKKSIATKGYGKLSGKLEIEITTKTPLFIPNTTNTKYFSESDREKDHKSFDFYSYEDLANRRDDGTLYSPVIPGSEIRGCIRSIHEALNNSCLTTFDRDENVFVRTKADGKESNAVSPAILEINGSEWAVYEANEYAIPRSNVLTYTATPDLSEITLRDGRVVQAGVTYSFELKYDEESEKKCVSIVGRAVENDGYYHGVLRIGNMTIKTTNKDTGEIIPPHHVASLFVKRGLVKTLDDREKKAFKRTLQDSQDAVINQKLKEGHTGYKNIKLDVERAEYPVYCDLNRKEFIRMSLAKLGKMASFNTAGDFFAGYEPCSDSNSLCMTCQLFGFIAKDDASCSKIRFSDATTSTNPRDCYAPKVTLLPLLGPHISNNFYYAEGQDLNSQSPEHAQGRKFYWNFEPKNYSAPVSKLNNTIRPVKEGVTFKATVYYEDLTPLQLQSVIDAIALFDEGHYQKMGHAKSLGFGSVSMKVVKNTQRTVSVENGKVQYKEEEKAMDISGTTTPAAKKMALMSDAKLVWDCTVKYPTLKWFGKNKRTQLTSLEEKRNEKKSLAFDESIE